MQSVEQRARNVGEQFRIFSADEIAGDSVLETLVSEKKPNVVLELPGLKGIAYLRTRNLVREIGYCGAPGEVKISELGYYFDQERHELIDFEARADGQIVPTEFVMSTTRLKQMRGIEINEEE